MTREEAREIIRDEVRRSLGAHLESIAFHILTNGRNDGWQPMKFDLLPDEPVYMLVMTPTQLELMAWSPLWSAKPVNADARK